MKIDPNDPWYPVVETDQHAGNLGVPIRLKLAAEMTKGILAGMPNPYDLKEEHRRMIEDDAEFLADDLIERANREEETDDDVRNV